jgi:DNA polymerase
LPERGLDVYSKSGAEVILMAWAFNDEPVSLWEPLRGQPFPSAVSEHIQSGGQIVAWNSSFEKSIFRHVLHLDLPIEQFRDPSVAARMLSLPGSLADVCQIIGLPNSLVKSAGKHLIKMFGEPARPASDDPIFGRQPAIFRDHTTNPVEWAEYAEYCRQDVVSMRAASKAMSVYPVPDSVWQGWFLDQLINSRGLPLDMPLVRGAAKIGREYKEILEQELKELTGLENPNSVSQMLDYLQHRGYPFPSLAKGFVTRIFGGEYKLAPEAMKALTLRKQSSKTSGAKLLKMDQIVSEDGWLRNQYMYMGASKTGRWASRSEDSSGAQVQNFQKPTDEFTDNEELCISLLRNGELGPVRERFKNPLEIVGSAVRPCVKAPPGYKFVCADLKSIEVVSIGFLARCEKILDVFRPTAEYPEGKDAYLDYESRRSGVPYKELETKYKAGDPETKKRRQYAKPPVLAGGFGQAGGEEKIDEHGTKFFTGLLAYSRSMNIPMTRDDCHEAVDFYREEYEEVPKYWYALERAAVDAIKNPGKVYEVGHVALECFGKRMLRMMLPAGRAIHYVRPRIIQEENKRGKLRDQIHVEGIDGKTHQWLSYRLYGSLICQNSVQGFARDLLLNGMHLAEADNVPVHGHTHDELLGLVPANDSEALARLIKAMTTNPEWCPAEQMPLAASGWEGTHYRKD